ncbi:MAG: DUF4026 domain-containing protein [Ruminococcus sp.]|nr:DUF4026 domain-containing protein [Ruminococcus sp.]
MFDPDKYMDEYLQLDEGAPRMRGIKKAIAAADAAKDAEWQFIFRDEYIHESVFHSDNVDAIIIFPELLAIYDSHPEIQEDCRYDLMWDFKYVLEDSENYYHVPLEQIESIFKEFSERCRKYGYSQRAYKYLYEKFTMKTGRFLPLKEYGSFADEPADDLKDCEACEQSFRVKCALLQGDEEKAKKLFEPLERGTMHCAEVPEYTYAARIEYFIKQGRYDEAVADARRLYPMVRRRMDLLECVGVLLCMYSKVNISAGINIFRRELPNAMACRNHRMKLIFAEGAYRLFGAMGDEEIRLVLTKDFPLWNAENNYSAKAISEYFYGIARDLAEKFDKRNGNSFYRDRLEEVYPDSDGDSETFFSGYVSRTPAFMAAPCGDIPEKPDWNEISERLKAKGLKINLSAENEEKGSFTAQISEEDFTCDVGFVYSGMPDPRDFKLMHKLTEAQEDNLFASAGMLMTIMYADEQTDIAMLIQLKVLEAVCPDAPAYFDFSANKVLSGDWVRLQVKSNVPPTVDYIYGIEVLGDENNDYLWITTRGLNACGLRELEIFDADKENYSAYCDLICFTAERLILMGYLPPAQESFNAVRKADGSWLSLSWLPSSKVGEYYYPEDDLKGLAMRMAYDEDELTENAVLFIHGGEREDGTVKLKPLGTLTDGDFENLRYGSFYATDRKIEALAKDRLDLFARAFEKYPDSAFIRVCIDYDDEEYAWVKITEMGNKIKGLLDEECSAGKVGDEFTVNPENVTNFSIRLSGDEVMTPDSAYLIFCEE